MKLVLAILLAYSLPTFAGKAIDIAADQIQLDGSIKNHSILDRSANQKYVVLEFFQTSCGPCKYNLGLWPKILKDVGANVELRTISIDRKRQATIDFVKSNRKGITWEFVIDDKRAVWDAYKAAKPMRGTPTTIIYDQNGDEVYWHDGSFYDKDIQEIKDIVSR